MPGNTVDAEKLPDRAFDSPEQREQTIQLLNDYNDTLHVTPELDARFAALAAERVHHSLLRYYVVLPLMRIADMWLRPRTETLPSDTRWWEFDDDPKWLALTLGLGIVNLAYLAAALAGLVRGRFAPHLGLLLTFVILRSAFLGTLENPETRYTLECYPVVIILAAALFQPKSGRRAKSDAPDLNQGANRSCGSACARARKAIRWRRDYLPGQLGPGISSLRPIVAGRRHSADQQSARAVCGQSGEESGW